MPVAYTSTVLSQLWTRSAIAAEIDTRMVAIGYTRRFLNTASNPCWGVYSIAAPNPGNIPIFLRFRIGEINATTVDFDWGVGDGHPNVNSETVNNISDAFEGGGRPQMSWSANEQFPLRFESFSSSEIKLVSVHRPGVNQHLNNVGLFFPSAKTSWWASSNKAYGFIARNQECSLFRTYKGSPVINNTTVVCDMNIAWHNLVQVNKNGTKDTPIGSVSVTNGEGGWIGTFSSDFGLIHSGGMNTQSEQRSISGGNYQTRNNSGESLLIRTS